MHANPASAPSVPRTIYPSHSILHAFHIVHLTFSAIVANALIPPNTASTTDWCTPSLLHNSAPAFCSILSANCSRITDPGRRSQTRLRIACCIRFPCQTDSKQDSLCVSHHSVTGLLVQLQRKHGLPVAGKLLEVNDASSTQAYQQP